MYCYWEEKFDVGHCLRDGQGGNGLQPEMVSSFLPFRRFVLGKKVRTL